MPDKLGYQSGPDRLEASGHRRQRVWKAVLGAAGFLIVGLVLVLAAWSHHETHIMHSNDLVITNNTAAPIINSSFFSIVNQTVGSTGPIGVGQTLHAHFSYGENDCPAGFVFQQQGKTFYVRLDDGAEDGEQYVITIATGKLTAICKRQAGATTTFVQVPSTQPLDYLR